MSTDGQNHEVLSCSGVTLDCRHDRAVVAGLEIRLTTSERRILEALIRQPGQTVQRSDLLRTARGADTNSSARTIDVHIRAIRRKLGDAGKLIETVRSVGYRFSSTGFL